LLYIVFLKFKANILVKKLVYLNRQYLKDSSPFLRSNNDKIIYCLNSNKLKIQEMDAIVSCSSTRSYHVARVLHSYEKGTDISYGLW
jgi:hypothetical protein